MAKSKAHNQSYVAHRDAAKKLRRRRMKTSTTKGRNLLLGTIRNSQSPIVELSTLRKVLKVVVDSRDQLRVTNLILHDKNFFRKLMDWFRVCEGLENKEGLHMIYEIVKRIILLNDPHIFEKVFDDELVMDVIGCLEYDMEPPHVNHRNFLKENVVFKEAIPIKDPRTLSTIHQTYKISYLKNVVLPRVLDKATAFHLEVIIRSNNRMVVTSLTDDSTFIMELFARLKSPTTSHDSRKILVYFLHEFCCLIMSLWRKERKDFFRYLLDKDLYGVVIEILQSEDKKLVLTGANILSFSVRQDPTLLRTYVSLKDDDLLISLLFRGMLIDFGDTHCQFLEIIESLLCSFDTAEEGDAIVEIFYDGYLDVLIDFITWSARLLMENFKMA